MVINQSIVDEVKQKPIADQVRFVMEIMDNISDISKPKIKGYLMQFEDILKDLKIANKKVGGSNSNDEFYKLRINEVVKMQLDRTSEK